MKKLLKAFLIFLICFVIALGGFAFFLTRGLQEGTVLAIRPVDIFAIPDGTYQGAYQAGRFSNEIEVEIRDQKIMNITIIRDVQFGRQEISDKLFARIIEEQSLDVDAVSQATVTSKAYLKAIENALTF